jgi:pyruvate kinase
MRLTKTKIVCTLGPASSDEKVLRAMLKQGMDCARLNFSHGTSDEKRALVKLLRRLGDESGNQLAVMCDVQGPKIRVGKVSAPFVLKEGDETRVTSQKLVGDAKRFTISLSTLLTDLKVGDDIFLNDGVVRLAVKAVEADSLLCNVVAGGPISDHKGCNIPKAKLSISILTDKDKEDLRVIAELDPEYVAVSFVSTAEDLHEVRQFLKDAGNTSIKLIAKIERPVALGKKDVWICAFLPHSIQKISSRSSRLPTRSWWRAATWAWKLTCGRCPCGSAKSFACAECTRCRRLWRLRC